MRTCIVDQHDHVFVVDIATAALDGDNVVDDPANDQQRSKGSERQSASSGSKTMIVGKDNAWVNDQDDVDHDDDGEHDQFARSHRMVIEQNGDPPSGRLR
jgi:hypothetical protein